MPLSRRRRPNPPDQPENNNHLADHLENAKETLAPEQSAMFSQGIERRDSNQDQIMQNQPDQASSLGTPQAPFHTFASVQSSQGLQATTAQPSQAVPLNQIPQTPIMNGDRVERIERQDYTSAPTPSLEGGRRTARGELFRRPPQPPVPQPVPVSVGAASMQVPVREISLPLGNLLHLAYNPGYTGAEEARKALLEHLEKESKTGGRARCWSCGSLGIVYGRWDTHSKAFNEIGVAFCEICGVWSVM